MVEDKKQQEIEIPADGISLDLLKAVYRNNQLPLTTRMRAAIAALPFEVPKLAVTAVVSEQDFATLLDRRLKRNEEMKAKRRRRSKSNLPCPIDVTGDSEPRSAFSAVTFFGRSLAERRRFVNSKVFQLCARFQLLPRPNGLCPSPPIQDRRRLTRYMRRWLVERFFA